MERSLALRMLRNRRIMVELVKLGRTRREIAAQLGVSRSTVRSWQREHGIDPRRGQPHEPA